MWSAYPTVVHINIHILLRYPRRATLFQNHNMVWHMWKKIFVRVFESLNVVLSGIIWCLKLIWESLTLLRTRDQGVTKEEIGLILIGIPRPPSDDKLRNNVQRPHHNIPVLDFFVRPYTFVAAVNQDGTAKKGTKVWVRWRLAFVRDSLLRL